MCAPYHSRQSNLETTSVQRVALACPKTVGHGPTRKFLLPCRLRLTSLFLVSRSRSPRPVALALVLTCQVFAGAFLGIAAQFVLAIGVIFYVLPGIGLELLDTARAVAEFDLPMRVLRLWWGDPH